MRADAVGPVRHRFLTCACVLLLLTPVGGAHAHPTAQRAAQAASALPPQPSCLDAHDLLITQSAVSLSGGTYNRVCIVDGGVLTLSSSAVLRTGELYIDGSSTLSADGEFGGRPTSDDCAGYGNGMADGSPGGTINVTARSAVVVGQISAIGGAGADGTSTPCGGEPADPGGHGGPGGTITLTVGDLNLWGTITAAGGDGGPGAPPSAGGHGGTITIAAQHIDPTWSQNLLTTGGKSAQNGALAPAGMVTVAALGAAGVTALPPAPPPLTQRIGAAPTLLPVQTSATFAAAMGCGSGNLVVPKGTSVHMHGVHSYAHICLHGTIIANGSLTLLAQTIQVAATAGLQATGVMSSPAPPAPTDACAPDHALPRAGFRGQPGDDSMTGPGGRGGLGGGAITLVAQRLLFAGEARANGGAGGQGVDGDNGSPTSGPIPPSGGGQGGAGGSITLVAQDLQLTGRLSAQGGPGGPNGAAVDQTGTSMLNLGGQGGCVRVFATTLRTSAAALTIPGTLYYGHSTAFDPVPPVTGADVQYSATTFHTMRDPFLSFWRRHNGLVIFGEPISEVHAEGGRMVQYFERSLLILQSGRVLLAPLGVLLTAGRSFPTVPPFADTAVRRYFPATRHSLDGRFLAFWLSHQGMQVFGAPISEPLMEANGDGSGRTYLVQYFQNARMEYHPEVKNPQFEVSLGLLGREYAAVHASGA